MDLYKSFEQMGSLIIITCCAALVPILVVPVIDVPVDYEKKDFIQSD